MAELTLEISKKKKAAGQRVLFLLAWINDPPAAIHCFQKKKIMAYVERGDVSFPSKEIVDGSYKFHRVRSDISDGSRHPGSKEEINKRPYQGNRGA